MRAIKYRELRRMYELNGPRQTVQHLNEALGEGHLRPEDFSIRDLAEATLGTQRVRALDPRHGEYVLEAGDGVDVTAFSNIAGQVVQAKVLELFQELQRELQFACLFVTHDLAVVDVLASRIIVMQNGRIVEQGTSDQVLRNPQDPYTQRLISAVPYPDPEIQRQRRAAPTNGF